MLTPIIETWRAQPGPGVSLFRDVVGFEGAMVRWCDDWCPEGARCYGAAFERSHAPPHQPSHHRILEPSPGLMPRRDRPGVRSRKRLCDIKSGVSTRSHRMLRRFLILCGA